MNKRRILFLITIGLLTFMLPPCGSMVHATESMTVSFSEGVVNPIYEDVIAPEEIAAPTMQEIEALSQEVSAHFDELTPVTADDLPAFEESPERAEEPEPAGATAATAASRGALTETYSSIFFADGDDPSDGTTEVTAEPEARYLDYESAGAYIMDQFLLRAPEIVVPVQITTGDELAADYVAIMADEELTDAQKSSKKLSLFARELWRVALTHHPEDPRRGDYSAYQYGGYGTGSQDMQMTNGDTGNRFTGVIIYKLYSSSTTSTTFPAGTSYYYTTAEQEAELDAYLSQLLPTLYQESDSDFQKVRAIYDYITRHVKYGRSAEGRLPYTPYGALIKGEAVCQGYAGLFYRMALTAGVDNRIQSGYAQGENHAWNVIRMGDQCYYGDATWDRDRRSEDSTEPLSWFYFLCGTSDFSGHVANNTLERVTINGHETGARPNRFDESAYPMSATEYWGDVLVRDRSEADGTLYGNLRALINGKAEDLWVAPLPTEAEEPALYRYNGSEIRFDGLDVADGARPWPHVYDQEKALTEGVDYTLFYRNNRDVGTATVTVGFCGNYSGSKELTWQIAPAELSVPASGPDPFTVEGAAEETAADGSISRVVYGVANGTLQTPAPALLYGETRLKSGTDYTISYTAADGTALDGFADPGDYRITYTGMGNFTGSRTIRYGLKKPTWTVTYSGISAEELASDSRYQTGYSAGESISFPEPAARPGYTFQGWYLSASLDSKRITTRNVERTLFVLTPEAMESFGVTGNLVLYPRFTGNAVRVILHASADAEQETGKNAPTEVSFQVGIPQALPAVPYAGMGAFRGWYKDRESTEGIDYRNQETICFGAEDGQTPIPSVPDGEEDPVLDLYARFSESSQLTLRIHTGRGDGIADAGSFTASAEAPDVYYASFRKGEKCTLPKLVTRPGYTFGGWVDAATGKVIKSVTVSCDAVYDAAFVPCKVTVKYNKNAPKNSVIGGTAPATETRYYETDAHGVASSFAPTAWNKGVDAAGTHRFVGWYADKACTTPVTDLFAAAPAKNQTVTLYAKWEEKSYAIRYCLWGTGEEISVNAGAPTAGTCGTAVSVKDVTPASLDAGITFRGWYTGTAETLGKKTVTISAKNYEDVTLYAYGDVAYEIELNGTGKETVAASVLKGKALPKYARLKWALADTQAFAGWATSPDGAVAYADGAKLSFAKDAAGYAAVVQSLDVWTGQRVLPLYAVITERSAVQTVHFVDAAGNPAAPDATRAMGTASAKTFLTDKAKELVIPTGYTFGWWSDRMTGKKVTGLGKKDYRPSVTLQTNFNVKKVSITYQNNLPAAVNGKAAVKKGSVLYSGAAKFLKNRWKTAGYTFVCWAADPEGTKPVALSGGTFVPGGEEAYHAAITEGTDAKKSLTATLYAIWEPGVYTYTYDAYGTGKMVVMTKTMSEHLETGLAVPAARSGYRFVGWYRYKADKNGLVLSAQGQPVMTKTQVKVPAAEDLYLYGKWEALASARNIVVPADAINVEDFGAYADDGVDDRVAITNAIAHASPCYQGGPDATAASGQIRTVYVPSGTYDIKIQPNGRGIDLTGWDGDARNEYHEFHSNYVRVLMEDDTVLKADTSALGTVDHYSVFYVLWTDHVTIEGGVVDGNRGKVKSGGHGIDASGATNLTLRRVTVQNATLDGVYLGEEKAWDGSGFSIFRGNQIKLEQCTVKNNARNNIAVVGADNVTINRCQVADAHGIRPQTGILVEPNPVHGGHRWPCKNLTVSNTTVHVYQNITGQMENHFCFMILGGAGETCAENVNLINNRFYGDVYIGNAVGVTNSGTVTTGTYYNVGE